MSRGPPGGETKAGEKAVNEKPRRGNGLTHEHIPVVGAPQLPGEKVWGVGGGLKNRLWLLVKHSHTQRPSPAWRSLTLCSASLHSQARLR